MSDFPVFGVGVHYPGDVLAAAILGIFASAVACRFVSKLILVKKLLGIYEKGEQIILPSKKKARGA
ncbi:hypothetical protein F3157_10730 [Virgibacillus dakarensis]|uniref:Phosphatidic acid phosphatase type 2/haloperoxidase domain-containing protein n=1 Tax=Lentibacillus populi TaxID=1827502 RepID=A0A9W5TYS1_9BACI|nr:MULTISPECIES: hypothetical protein [Bacillaceae]MTW86131.1 hypothetical protein [Virgibacillus dakarensis]GGB46388.1 hypothetical protein GCM10011409_24930 [Lentibacillus populi]